MIESFCCKQRHLIIFETQYNKCRFRLILYSYTSTMKLLIILVILFMLTVQLQVVLLASSSTNALVLFPFGANSVVEEWHHNQYVQNYLYKDYGARWLWRSGGDAFSGQIIYIESKFYASCTSFARLMIAADDLFRATLNGGSPMIPVQGTYWSDISYFKLNNIKCGLNTLRIRIRNKVSTSNGFNPACAIYTIVQEQGSCFTCLTPLAFYNKKTCKCQCINGCNCTSNVYSPLMKWYDYPTCGCKCKSSPQKCSKFKYWNEATCRCQCKQIYCIPGYQQHSTQCFCVRVCPPGTSPVCPQGKYFDEIRCKCVCKIRIQYCPSGKINQETCQCIYELMKRPEWL